jgi:V8-like Glu-specific endopeptidase
MKKLAAVAALAAALALPSAALGQPHVRATAAPAAGAWTPQRMAQARPLELLRRDHGSLRLRRSHAVPFGSGEVLDPTVSPNSTNGRLFGHIDGLGDYSCSATVLDTTNGRVILTAGHCVFDPRLLRFARDLSFVPAYSDGTTPFGVWEWTSLLTTRQWVVAGNSNFDYAAIKLATVNGSSVETAVGGGRPLRTNIQRNQGYGAFGYPANFSSGERMHACLSGYAGKDPRPFPTGKAATAIGCDMTEGASGGGWVNGAGNLVSVSSFGYRNQPDVLYGPYLTVLARQIVGRLGG